MYHAQVIKISYEMHHAQLLEFINEIHYAKLLELSDEMPASCTGTEVKWLYASCTFTWV